MGMIQRTELHIFTTEFGPNPCAAQWEILAIFGSLQNPDFILHTNFPQKTLNFFSFGAVFCDFTNFGAKF